MFKRNKILCYVLIFDQVDIIKKSLDYLTKSCDQLEIVVIENPSKNTSVIRKYIESLGKNGLVSRYYLFDKNITGNSLKIVFKKELELIRRNQYIVVTDGDLVSHGNGWIKEEKDLLKKHRDIFACGVSLDRSNLPLEAFPEANSWIPDDISKQADYHEAITGGHLLMFRGKDFASYMKWREENNLSHIDGVMHRYCYDVIHKKWARTKESVAYHLTWDLYQDKNHPYTKLKTAKSFQSTWYHDQHAEYSLIEFTTR